MAKEGILERKRYRKRVSRIGRIPSSYFPRGTVSCPWVLCTNHRVLSHNLCYIDVYLHGITLQVICSPLSHSNYPYLQLSKKIKPEQIDFS